MTALPSHTTTPVRKPLRVLLIEDSAIDTDLIIRKLADSGYDVDWQRVDTAAALRAALANQTWDVAFSDYTMPRFSCLEALEIVKASGLDLPFIVVSGAIGEETAVEAMRLGAHDYLLKDRLTRLGPAVERALSEAEGRRARRQAEEARAASEMRYRRLFEADQDGILILDARTGQVLDVNPFLLNLLGYSLETLLGKVLWEIGPFQDIASSQAAFSELQDRGYIRYENLPLETQDGRRIEVEFVSNVYWVNDEKVIQCNVRDISERKRAEEALAAERRLLRTLIDSLPDYIYAKDAEGRFILKNQTDAHQMGADSPDETLGKTDFDYYPPELAAQYHADDQAVIQSGQPVINREEPIVDAEGNQGWTLTSKVPLLDDQGEVIGLVGIGHDITAMKRTEETLHTSEEKYRSLFEESFDGLFITSPGGKILDMNKKGVAMFGYDTKEEILSLDLERDIYAYPPDRQRILGMVNAQGTAEYEVVVKKKSGEQMVTHCALTAVKNEQGVITTYRGIIRDITERKQMETALQQERNLLRTLIDTLPDYIFVKDRQGRFVVSNVAHTQSVPHATPGDLIGKTPLELYPPKLGQQFHTDDMWVMDSGEMLINAERQTYNPDGTRRWVLTTKVPLKGPDGQIVGLVGVSRDITERKRLADAERDARILAEALRDTAAALTSTLEPDRVMARILENVGRVVPHDYASIMLIEGDVAYPACCRGWLPDEEATFRAVRFPLETQNLHEMILTHRPMVIPDTANSPEWVPIIPHMRAYIGAPICAHDRVVGFLDLLSPEPGFFTPVHAERLGAFADQAATAIENAQLYEELRRHASELERRVQERTAQLNHAKERIEAILNSSSDIMVLCRADGTIEQVNPAFSKAFGTGLDEALRRPLTQLIIPEHIPILEQALETVVETMQPTRVEVAVHDKGGATFDADVVLSPVVEHSDRLLGVICSLRNVTERKQMEDRLRQTLAHEMELSELKSRYVSMAAHDLRNPLAVIESSVGMLRHYNDRLTDEQKQSNYDRVHTSIKIMVDMLNDILTIGQVESGTLRFDPAPLDLIAFCQNITAEVQQVTMTTQRISFSGQGACETAYLDAKLLRHILGNLLSNAIKYSPGKSTVTLTVDCESDQITFCIQDQGIGIPQADQARLFEAFHRASNAKDVPGTGLGLAIVRQSVDLHDGTITFESEEGVGTTFTVILPQTPTKK